MSKVNILNRYINHGKTIKSINRAIRDDRQIAQPYGYRIDSVDATSKETMESLG